MSLDPKKFKTGIAVTGTATVGGDNITTNTAAQTLQNKTIDADSNTITNIDNADIKVGAAIDAAKIHDGSVSNTEFGYLDGVTSPIQTQLNNNATGLSDHLADVSDAHDASAISNVPAGNLAATDVQAALNELQSDIDSRALDADVIKKDGSVAFTANQSMGGFKLTGLGAPTAATDAATKEYVDNALEGLRPKEAVRVATTANITIASDLNVGDVIDGVTLVDGDRVLVKDQTAAENNGIYIAGATPARATDFDSLSPVDEINKAYVAVQEGTANQGKLYVQYGVVATLGTDPINFTFFNSISGLTGGDGITVSGNNISVDHDGEGLDFVAGQLVLELDGSTLSKSATGVKVADGGITNTQVNASAAIVYSKLNLSNSIVDADIASAAAIDASKLGNGDVSNTELSYVNGVTSPIQTQIDGKANTALSNLASTAINVDLLPGTADVRNLGDATNRFANLFHFSSRFYNATSTLVADIRALAANRFGIQTANGDSSASVELLSGTAAVSNSGKIVLRSGNSNGNSGDVELTTGTAVGTRGSVVVSATNLNMSSSKIVSLADPTAAQDAATKAYVDSVAGSGGSPGDIEETTFALTNNQASLANVTGFVFANAEVRSFKAQAVVEIDATADLYEVFELEGVQKGTDWSLSYSSTGDDSLVAFDITTAGQIQYTSGNYAGFVDGSIKFRALTLSV